MASGATGGLGPAQRAGQQPQRFLPPIRLQRPQYRPRWEGVFEAWSKNFVAANHWRVSALMEYEDALQECGAIFANCCKLYQDRVNNDRWFMAIYQRSVINSFHTRARKNQRAKLTHDAAIEMATRQHRSELSSGPLLTLLSEETREILKVILNAPSELLTIMIGNPPSSDEAWSRSLCRFARTKIVRSDIIFELKHLLD